MRRSDFDRLLTRPALELDRDLGLGNEMLGEAANVSADAAIPMCILERGDVQGQGRGWQSRKTDLTAAA